MKTQILLFDIYPIFRKGLKLILQDSGIYDVIGEASDKAQFFKILAKKKPDFILLNLMSAQDQVLTILKKLKIDFPDIPFMLIADGVSEFMIPEFVINGSKGIIWREDTPEHLLEVIQKALNGENYLNIPKFIENKELSLTNGGFTNNRNLQGNSNGFTVLSKREIEVVKLFADGNRYKDIADKLHISPRTVESHKKNILAKLNLDTIVDLAKFALKNKLIDN